MEDESKYLCKIIIFDENGKPHGKMTDLTQDEIDKIDRDKTHNEVLEAFMDNKLSREELLELNRFMRI